MKRERLRQAMVVLMLPLSIAAAAQGHKVSLHANGQSLTDILYQVERQSDYYKINYNARFLSKDAISKSTKTIKTVRHLPS